MKKKILGTLAASIFLALSTLGVIASCGKHEHTPETEWTTSETSHWHKCSGCEEKLDEAAHTFGEWTVSKEPTCTEPGEKYKTCSVCKYKLTEAIPSLGHKAGEEWLHDANNHWHVCETCGDKVDEAAHTYGEWTVTKEPTCSEKGKKERTCSVCGYKEVAEVDLLEHNKSNIWHTNETHHWHECLDCGEHLDEAEHTFGEWTVDKEATFTEVGLKHRECSVCHYREVAEVEKKSSTYEKYVVQPFDEGNKTCTVLVYVTGNATPEHVLFTFDNPNNFTKITPEEGSCAAVIYKLVDNEFNRSRLNLFINRNNISNVDKLYEDIFAIEFGTNYSHKEIDTITLTKAPTLTEVGTVEVKCKKCNQVVTLDMPKLDANYYTLTYDKGTNKTTFQAYTGRHQVGNNMFPNIMYHYLGESFVSTEEAKLDDFLNSQSFEVEGIPTFQAVKQPSGVYYEFRLVLNQIIIAKEFCTISSGPDDEIKNATNFVTTYVNERGEGVEGVKVRKVLKTNFDAIPGNLYVNPNIVSHPDFKESYEAIPVPDDYIKDGVYLTDPEEIKAKLDDLTYASFEVVNPTLTTAGKLTLTSTTGEKEVFTLPAIEGSSLYEAHKEDCTLPEPKVHYTIVEAELQNIIAYSMAREGKPSNATVVADLVARKLAEGTYPHQEKHSVADDAIPFSINKPVLESKDGSVTFKCSECGELLTITLPKSSTKYEFLSLDKATMTDEAANAIADENAPYVTFSKTALVALLKDIEIDYKEAAVLRPDVLMSDDNKNFNLIIQTMGSEEIVKQIPFVYTAGDELFTLVASEQAGKNDIKFNTASSKIDEIIEALRPEFARISYLIGEEPTTQVANLKNYLADLILGTITVS